MDIKASYLAISGGVEAMRADALLGILKERGRGFASDSETWAELRLSLTNLEKQTKNIKKVHDEMWAAVEDRNEDAFSALCQEFERAAATLSGEWARASVLAKIALEDPELPEEPTQEQKIAEDRERLVAIHEKQNDLAEVLPMAKGEVKRDMENEVRRSETEEQEIVVRLTAAGVPLEEPEGGADGEDAKQIDEIQKKRNDVNRARLNAIRTARMDIAERLPLEKKATATKLKKKDAELAAEEEQIVAELKDAGELADEPPDEP